jgi:hypothetical protein
MPNCMLSAQTTALNPFFRLMTSYRAGQIANAMLCADGLVYSLHQYFSQTFYMSSSSFKVSRGQN